MNILHLSDIHFGREDDISLAYERFENRERILDELISTVQNSRLPKPQHIIVTGDIAWKGKKQEFDRAICWFRKLLSSLHLQGGDISFCVGNHDINRNYAVKEDDSFFCGKDKESIKKIDALFQYERFSDFEAPQVNYDKFCCALGVEPFMYPLSGGQYGFSYGVGYKDIKVGCESIRIVAFNTSMLSYSKEIQSDKMWIGQTQLQQLEKIGILKKQTNSNMPYTIALFHHAERYLHPNEIYEYDGRIATFQRIMEDVDLLLCGHTEGGKPSLRKHIGGGKILTGGATYYNDDHPNSFSFFFAAKDSETYAPYIYKNRWQPYEEKERNVIEPHPEHKKPDFVFQNNGRMVIRIGDAVKTIPIPRLYFLRTNDSRIFHITNEYDPARNTNFVGNISSGGKDVISYRIPEHWIKSVEAQYETEQVKYFIQENLKDNVDASFSFETDDGIVFLTKLSDSTASAKKDIINYLGRLVNIERHFDVGFICPEVINVEEPILQLLEDFVDHGYSGYKILPEIVTINLVNKGQLQELYQYILSESTFCFFYDNVHLTIELHDTQIDLGKVQIESPGYFVRDLDDLRYKLDTFMEGDIRSIEFACINNSTAIISLKNITEGQEQILKTEITLTGTGGFALKLPCYDTQIELCISDKSSSEI